MSHGGQPREDLGQEGRLQDQEQVKEQVQEQVQAQVEQVELKRRQVERLMQVQGLLEGAAWEVVRPPFPRPTNQRYGDDDEGLLHGPSCWHPPSLLQADLEHVEWGR